MQELIKQAAAGSMEALGALYEANRGLVCKIALRYSGICRRDRATDIDDLMQVGFFAVMDAVKTYNPENGAWSGWLVFYLRRAMCNELGIKNGGALRPDCGAVSLDAPLSAEDSESSSRLDLLADPSLPDSDEELMRQEVAHGVRAAIGRIGSDRQRRALIGCELEQRSYSDVAADLGITASVCRGDWARGIKALRQDRELLCLAQAWELDQGTRFYAYKGAQGFRSDWTSTVEAAVLWREAERTRAEETCVKE